MDKLQVNLDLSSQKMYFKVDQKENFDYKCIDIEEDIFTFDFSKVKDDVFTFMQNDIKIHNVEILQLQKYNLQFVCQEQRQNCIILALERKKILQLSESIFVDFKYNVLFKKNDILFGAASYLDPDFQNTRKLQFDLPKVYCPSAERIVLKDYELVIQNEDIKVKGYSFYCIRFKNYIGEIQDHMICIVSYKIVSLNYVPKCNVTQEQIMQFQPMEIQNITKDQLMHFIQKVLTTIAEGNYFYSLQQNAIFINPLLQCLEFIALPIRQLDKEENIDYLSSENQILSSILKLNQDFDLCNNYGDQEIFVGNSLHQKINNKVQREIPLLCLNYQVGFPFYWYLFHDIVYNEIGPFQILKKKVFIVYKINDLYFYYDGKVNSKNEKHSSYQEIKSFIFCFNKVQHEFISSFQSNEGINEEQNESHSNKEIIQHLFNENFKINHNLLFEGCLKNNLPHGDCKIKIFINPLAKQNLTSLASINPFSEPLFKKNIEGNFDNGVLDGEGFIYQCQNEKEKERMYFDSFVDINLKQNYESIPNISMLGGKWMQRGVKKSNVQKFIQQNKSYYYIYYDASEKSQNDGRDLRQFRSIICQNSQRLQFDIDQVRKRKVFINIGKTESAVNYQKLFLKTNNQNRCEEIFIYVLYDFKDPTKISSQLANNIIFSFTENYVKQNSQGIVYINLGLISNVSQLHIETLLDPQKSIIEGLTYQVYQELPSKMKQNILFNSNHLDFSNCNKLLEEYLRIVFEMENIEIYKNLDKYFDQIDSKRKNSYNRMQSKQSKMNIKYSLTMRGCDLTNLKYFVFNTMNLRQLDISRAQVRDDFLNYLGTNETQFLTSLNISYTTLLYSTINNFFLLQDKPKEYLQTFICRNINISKNHLVQSTKTLFKNIIECELLKKVKYLDLSENYQINYDLLKTIYGFLNELKHLKISYCPNISGNDHQCLYINLQNINSNLTKLDYSGNQISFSYLQQQTAYRSIEVLDITNCQFKDQNLFPYLQTQKQLKKIKLDYSIFAENNFYFFETIFKYCQKVTKIHLLVKPNDNFDLEQIQRFISSGKLIDRFELNLYFNFQNQNSLNKEPYDKNYNRLLQKYLSYVNQCSFINIYFGKFQIIDKDAQDIDILFNYQQLKSLKKGLIYTPAQIIPQQQDEEKLDLKYYLDNQYINTVNLSGYDLKQLEYKDIEPYFNTVKNNRQINKFIFESSFINNDKAQKIIQSIVNSQINKISLNSSVNINYQMRGFQNLVTLQLKELKIYVQKEDIFQQLQNLQLVILDTLEIYFNKDSQVDQKLLSKLIQVTSLNQRLKISFDKYSMKNTENKLSKIFQCFCKKFFSKCIQFCLELKEIESLEIDLQIVSSIIENMSLCDQFSLTYLDSKMSNYCHFVDDISKLINKFSQVELELDSLDSNIIKFIQSQNFLQNLVLRIKNKDLHKQLPNLLKLPIKKLQIFQDENKDKVKKLVLNSVKESNFLVSNVYLNDEKLV